MAGGKEQEGLKGELSHGARLEKIGSEDSDQGRVRQSNRTESLDPSGSCALEKQIAYSKGRMVRGRETDRYLHLPFTGSLPKCLQPANLCQAESRNSSWSFSNTDRDPTAQVSICYLPRCITREPYWKWNHQNCNWCSNPSWVTHCAATSAPEECSLSSRWLS